MSLDAITPAQTAVFSYISNEKLGNFPTEMPIYICGVIVPKIRKPGSLHKKNLPRAHSYISIFYLQFNTFSHVIKKLNTEKICMKIFLILKASFLVIFRRDSLNSQGHIEKYLYSLLRL